MAPTQTFLVVLTHKCIKEPREDGGSPHTHFHNPYSCNKGMLRNPERRGGSPHTHIPYCFNRKYMKESRDERREGAHTHIVVMK